MYLNKSAKLHQWSNFFISSESIQTLLVSPMWWTLYSESSAWFLSFFFLFFCLFFVADASDWPAAELVPFLPDGNDFYWCDGAQNQPGVEGTQVSFCILHKSTSHFCSCLWVKPSRAFPLGRERKWVATLSSLVGLRNARHWLEVSSGKWASFSINPWPCRLIWPSYFPWRNWDIEH